MISLWEKLITFRSLWFLKDFDLRVHLWKYKLLNLPIVSRSIYALAPRLTRILCKWFASPGEWSSYRDRIKQALTSSSIHGSHWMFQPVLIEISRCEASTRLSFNWFWVRDRKLKRRSRSFPRQFFIQVHGKRIIFQFKAVNNGWNSQLKCIYWRHGFCNRQ